MIPNISARLARAATHLGQAVAFPTVSQNDYALVDTTPFSALQDWLLECYPHVAAQLEYWRNDPWHIHFRWRGSAPAADPLILLAHYDVVPAGDPATWKHPPFAGVQAEGQVWGRGTLDVKINLVSILEVVEGALVEGFVPQRDIWLCFGGDEEVGGSRGAGEIGRALQAAGVSQAWLLDEGGVIARDALAFAKKPLALVGIAEKGFVNLRLSVTGSAGHASMPPAHTAAGLLAAALVKVERRPFPARLTATLRAFLRSLAPQAPLLMRLLLSSPGLFWPLLRLVFAANPKMAAMIQTTQAITMLSASDKENVLPALASAIINVRILPGESSASVLRHFQNLMAGGPCGVEIIDPQHLIEPLPQSEIGGPAWDAVVAALAAAESQALPMPYLVTASTDTRHYLAVANRMYRIQALLLDSAEISLIHNVDERISLENIGRSLRFYDSLIRS